MSQCAPITVESVEIVNHAMTQAAARLSQIPVDRLNVEIVSRVKQACHNGQVYTARPRQFRVSGERPLQVPFWQRIAVYGDSAFVIDVTEVPKVTVITVFKALR